MKLFAFWLGGWFTMMWVGIGSVVVGAAGTLYGANAQKTANNKAMDANVAAQDKQNNSAWTNWLMSRGIQPNSPVQAGVTPGPGQYTAVNTKLPLWATMSVPVGGGNAPGGLGGTRIKLTGTARG